MLKPTGLLCYATGNIAGSGGTFVADLVADNDDSGNHYDATKVNPSTVGTAMAYWFSPQGVAGSGDAAKVFPSLSISTGGQGEITSLQVTLTNNSAAGGDTVSGRLYILLPQRGNFGV